MATTTAKTQADQRGDAPGGGVPQGGFTAEALERWIVGRREPAWLAGRRREAFARFATAPWPTLRDEEWRRTDVRALKLTGFAPPAHEDPTADESLAFRPRRDELKGQQFGQILEHVNGHAAQRTEREILPAGVVFESFETVLRTRPELLERHLLTRAVDPATDIFSALHSAFWTGGTLLYVPKGVRIETPLTSLVGLTAQGRVDLHHTLVVLEEGAEATLVVETTSPGRDPAQAALHAGAVEMLLGERSRLRFVSIQDWDLNTWHLSRDRAILERGASLQWTVGGLGSRLAKVNQEVVLAGEQARAQVNGVLFTSGRQNLTYLTRQDHAAANTTSDLLYKGGLMGHSRLVWKGMIRVEPGAQKTDAYQKNDNLVLADTSRADSIPGLEIEANDVRCTHGATAGRVDQDMVFYLMSRGVGRDEAVRLIVEGFFANVYDRITLEPVRETLRRAVAAKLGGDALPA